MATGTLSDCSSRTGNEKQMIKMGEKRIKKVQENDDVAIISMIPINGDVKFRCFLGRDCKLRDWKKAEPGEMTSKKLIYLSPVIITIKYTKFINCLRKSKFYYKIFVILIMF